MASVYDESLGLEDFRDKHCRTTPERITLKTFEPFVCAFFGLTPEELYENTRRESRSHPRQVLMFLALRWGKQSLSDIGARMGGLDHTTIMYGRNKVKDLLEQDAQDLRVEAVRAIEQHFKEIQIL